MACLVLSSPVLSCPAAIGRINTHLRSQHSAGQRPVIIWSADLPLSRNSPSFSSPPQPRLCNLRRSQPHLVDSSPSRTFPSLALLLADLLGRLLLLLLQAVLRASRSTWRAMAYPSRPTRAIRKILSTTLLTMPHSPFPTNYETLNPPPIHSLVPPSPSSKDGCPPTSPASQKSSEPVRIYIYLSLRFLLPASNRLSWRARVPDVTLVPLLKRTKCSRSDQCTPSPPPL